MGKVTKRGYIAMLAVDSSHRKKRIGSTLVKKAIEAMVEDDADEVVLETEITNKPALKLYENLGFVRDKRLFREAFKNKNCIFYDIWQKGRGSKDQNQISERNLNLDKVLGGVGKRLQCHKNSYFKNLV